MKSLRTVLAALLLAFTGAASLSATSNLNTQSDIQPVFLEADDAFRMTARALDANTVELRFEVAEGYYLYRDRFKLSADAGAVLGDAAYPPALRKDDAQFGVTPTYRGSLVIPVKVNAANGPFTLSVKTQGCADAGLCYPPFVRTASFNLPVTANSNLSPYSEAPNKATPNRSATDESAQVQALFTHSSLPWVLLSFFGFGLLLAFTPCVFPMIPILSGIIVGQGKSITKRRALMLSLTYVIGMAVTYTAAGVAAGLSGSMLAAALQNAWVLGGFALIFVLLSLSMFGFYELQMPTSLQTRLSASANQQSGSLLGVGLMGALSALIVGPCVAAPLAGALLYIAQTKDALLGGAALFSMALGMGAPLVLVGTAAGSLLPRAGTWMEGVKKAFGVMLLGVAVWLVSPVLPAWAVMLAWAALLLFSGVYWHALDALPANASGWARIGKGAGVVAALAGAAMFIGVLSGSRDVLQPLAALRANSNTPTQSAQGTGLKFQAVRSVEELDAVLARADRPVMLDFYADWCVSCKEMEHLTLSDSRVRARLSELLLLKVDVTANTAQHQALAKRYGLFGPPAIVFLRPAAAHPIAELGRVVGYLGADAFLARVNASLGNTTLTQVQ